MSMRERYEEETSKKLEDAIEHEKSDEVFENDDEDLLWKIFEAENEEEVENEEDHESEESEQDEDEDVRIEFQSEEKVVKMN